MLLQHTPPPYASSLKTQIASLRLNFELDTCSQSIPPIIIIIIITESPDINTSGTLRFFSH